MAKHPTFGSSSFFPLTGIITYTNNLSLKTQVSISMCEEGLFKDEANTARNKARSWENAERRERKTDRPLCKQLDPTLLKSATMFFSYINQ